MASFAFSSYPVFSVVRFCVVLSLSKEAKLFVERATGRLLRLRTAATAGPITTASSDAIQHQQWRWLSSGTSVTAATIGVTAAATAKCRLLYGRRRQRLRAGAVLTERGRILSWGILPKLLKKEAKKQSSKCWKRRWRLTKSRMLIHTTTIWVRHGTVHIRNTHNAMDGGESYKCPRSN